MERQSREAPGKRTPKSVEVGNFRSTSVTGGALIYMNVSLEVSVTVLNVGYRRSRNQTQRGLG